MLVLKYRLTEDEYLDYNYYTAWTSPEKKPHRQRYYFQVMALYVAVAGLYIFANKSHSLLIDSTVFLVIGICYFALVPMIVKRSIRSRVKSILSKPENQHVLDESEVILEESGITDKDTVSNSRYSWESIVRKAETRLCFYLYTSAYHAIVIPKRAVPHHDEKLLHTMFDRNLSLSSDFAT